MNNTAAFQSACKQAVLDIFARQGGGMLMVDPQTTDRLSIGIRLLRRAGLVESTGVNCFWRLAPKAVAAPAAVAA